MAGRGGIRWTQGDPAAASAALRRAADDVHEAVTSVVRAAPDALKRAFPDEARATLPKRGGLADLVAGADLQVVEDVAGDRVGVTVTASHGKVSLGPLNDGDLRHPVRGNRRVWVRQRVRSGMWQRACDTAAQGQDDELLQALRDTARDAAQRSR